ncbi:hypothetical protein [Natronorarus salvus]|uniref:hypothetical protein n=1 Tax=Natronorarus salvus TaxID=3117733 RepID=UPI002F26D1AC
MDVPREVRERLEALPHVIGTCIGKRREQGCKTDETCLVVLVKEKVPDAQLDPDDRIPETIDLDGVTVRTDVQQVGDVTVQAVVEERDRQGRLRPAPGGVSGGHPEITTGTMGSTALETEGGETVVLTNAHVAAPVEVAEEGDAFLQPGVADGGDEGDAIGELVGWSEVREDEPNESDSALVAIDPGDIDDEILGVGALVGWTEADIDEDEEFTKGGRTTGVTTGDLRGVDGRIEVGGFFDRPVTFEGLDIYGPLSAGGDSGSLIGVLEGEGFRAASLLFAGSDEATLGVPMRTVEEVHGELTPVERGDGNGGEDDGPGDDPDELVERVRARLESAFDEGAVTEGEGVAFRVAAWPVGLAVAVAEGDVDEAVGRAAAAAIDGVVPVVVTEGSELETRAGVQVVPIE